MKVILNHDPVLKDMLKLNLFTSEVDIVRDVPELHIKKGMVNDRYVDVISEYIESSPNYNHTLFDPKKIRSAINIVALEHQYNPVLDYFKECKENWDGNNRLDDVFTEYLGASKAAVNSLIAKLFFCGAVAKAINPAIKFDYVLDLVGGQGAGKTTFLKKIAPCGYYTDQFFTFTNKDDFAVMRRALIINDDEMTATRISTFEELKKFITLDHFEYRKPYGHEAERFDKNFIMARTTNELYYLKDKTGERRFLPVMVRKDKQTKHPVTDLNQATVDQIWGEAVSLYQSGQISFGLSEEEAELLEQHRLNFMYTDETEDKIEELLVNEFANSDFLTGQQIADKIAPGMNLVSNRKLAQQISYIMINRFGWRKGQKRVGDKRKKGYLKS